MGAVAGAATGAAIDPGVRTYVVAQNVPTVTYSGEVVVGKPLAGQVTYYEIPKYSTYRWAYLNGQRVVVDSRGYVVAVY